MEHFENKFGPYGSDQCILEIKHENTFQTQSGGSSQAKKSNDICRLCLLEIKDNNLTLLEGIIKDMLEIILPELKLSICESPTICNNCLETLKQSYNFKSSCLEVEDKVQDFINPKNPSLIDLRAVIFKRNSSGPVKENQMICRTCLNVVEKSAVTKLYSFEGDPLKNMVDKCLPEMGIELTKEPVICPMCLELLEEQFHFIMQCLDSEEKINYYCEKKNCYKQVNLHSVYMFSMSIEDDNCMENTDTCRLQSSYSETCVNSQKNIQENGIKTVIESSNNNQIQEIKIEPNFEDIEQSLVEIQESDVLNNSEQVENTSDDLLQVKRAVKVAKPQEQRKKEEIRKAKLINDEEESESEDDPEDFSYYPTGPKKVILQKCKYCKFKTRFKSKLKAHLPIHHQSGKLSKLGKLETKVDTVKEPEEVKNVKPFKCPKCNMTFRYVTNMEKHLGSHEQRKAINPCSYRASYVQKHTYRFDRHMLTMYRCKLCQYQSRLKSNLDKHSKTHKSTSDIRMHKCKVCKFETIQKETLVSHMKTHEDGPQNKMRKCFLCSYQTKRIDYLKKHVKNVHKAGSG